MKRFFLQLAVAALPLMLFLAAGCESFFNDIADEPCKIAFRSTRAGGVEIFTMNADGSEQTQITFGGANNKSPRWSPDGEKITFVKGTFIYIMDADGSNQVQITSGAADAYPSWSPDGTQLVYSDGTNLRIVDIASKTIVGPATTTTGSTPHWSPRSGKIAFMNANNIYTVNPDGTGVYPITSLGTNLTPFWSINGSQILFARNVGDNQIHIINDDGSDLMQLTFFPTGGFNTNSPSMSADGERIVFHSNISTTWQIHIMDADGSNTNQLTFEGVNTEPCFSPQ